jgi:hypothetical protein
MPLVRSWQEEAERWRMVSRVAGDGREGEYMTWRESTLGFV